MRGLYKKPRLLIGTSSGYAQLQRAVDANNIDNILDSLMAPQDQVDIAGILTSLKEILILRTTTLFGGPSHQHKCSFGSILPFSFHMNSAFWVHFFYFTPFPLQPLLLGFSQLVYVKSTRGNFPSSTHTGYDTL